MKILLIAGHGGTPYDPGTVGCGYTEAVETRRMANLSLRCCGRTDSRSRCTTRARMRIRW